MHGAAGWHSDDMVRSGFALCPRLLPLLDLKILLQTPKAVMSETAPAVRKFPAIHAGPPLRFCVLHPVRKFSVKFPAPTIMTAH